MVDRKSNKKSKMLNKKGNKQAFSSVSLMIFFVVGLFLFFVSYVEGEHLWRLLHNSFLGFFGLLAMVIGPVYIFVAIFYALKSDRKLFKHKIYEIFALLLLLCAIVQTYDFENVSESLNFFERLQQLKVAWNFGLQGSGGGAVGELLSLIFSYFFGRQVAFLCFWILFFVMFFLVSGINFVRFIQVLVQPLKNLKSRFDNTGEELEVQDDFYVEDGIKKSSNKNKNSEAGNVVSSSKVSDDFDLKDENFELVESVKTNEISNETLNFEPLNFISRTQNKNDFDGSYSEIDAKSLEIADGIRSSYVFPSIDLLNKPPSDGNVDVSVELKSNAARLVDTLKSFGVETRIINISRGPSVTRYELQPSAGVKISKITNLADDISLNLAVGGVRIEAPIPNKAAVGIEVANKKREVVYLREIVANSVFSKAKSPLTFALGKDIAGNVVVSDIAKMPHVLIAGATGSGKSVCINSLIVSLIYKSSPDEVKLLLIDPKVVELGVYGNIAHLLIPVVTEPKKAAGALNWAVSEMLKRYKIFAKNGVRDLKSYNSLVESRFNEQSDINKSDGSGSLQKLAQIVIIIDELADLMMAASKEVENSICRLAQMARAAGMHLVIATQRPSVDVITGLIKANVPSRIAFTVSSQVDSRTIIDMSGAEKLLGKGDMLYFPVGEQKPLRVQGCFLSDGEVERVVSSVRVVDESGRVNSQYDEEILEEIERHSEISDEAGQKGDEFYGSRDVLFNDAVELIVESGRVSTSFLQRRLKIGYSRAARIVDEMESAGIVSGQNSGKGRKVLISRQQFLEMNLNREE